MNALDGQLFLALHHKIIDFGIHPFVLRFFADILPYGAIALGLAIVLWQERGNIGKMIKSALLIVGSAALSRVVIAELIRFFWNRPRPFEVLDIVPLLAHDGGHSFPSGHAAFFFAAAAALWLLNRNLGWAMFAAALLMGIARVAGGVHWPSDIVAGAAIGIISAALVRYTIRILLRPQSMSNYSN